jgi:transmembrane sensor
MNRPEPDSPAAQRRAAEAAEWLVKRDRGLTAAEQDDFLGWLAADPRHGEWLALHRRVTGDFRALAQWRPEHSEEPNPDLLARAPRRTWWYVPAGLAAAAAVALLVLPWRAREPEAAAPATVARSTEGAADFERRVLEDGSTVDLNRGATVRVAYTERERRVDLVRGEALFTVASNPARPFVVRAGGVDVRAVGTAFNVRLAATAVEVLVTEGKVQVAAPATGTAGAAGNGAGAIRVEAPIVTAGQRATVATDRAEAPVIEAVSARESARLLAWQPQLLDFSSAPLGRALEEFNRRNRVQFVLEDPGLATLPVVATVRSDRVDGFAEFLAATPGVAVERRGEYEIVVRRKR